MAVSRFLKSCGVFRLLCAAKYCFPTTNPGISSGMMLKPLRRSTSQKLLQQACIAPSPVDTPVFEITSYLGLFLAAFGAASLLPMQSEAVLVAMLLSGKYAVTTLLIVATLGNVLGSILNWLLGRSVEHFRHKRWFPVSEQKLARAQQFYLRYGRWSLLLSWVPIIGDPLTMIAGVMGEPLWRFVLIVTLAKGARYLALAALTLGWT